MNHKTISFIFFILILPAFFLNYAKEATPKYSPLQVIKDNYHHQLRQTDLEITALLETANKCKTGVATTSALQAQIVKTRLQFKKIEFLLDYFDPFLVAKSINGAPLPKLEPKIPIVHVLEPSGLQTLDEKIFSPEPEKEIDAIIELTEQLKKVFNDAVAYQTNQDFQHRYVLEALRYGLIRVFTLGLTGFDTPGSANAISEASTSMASMQQTFQSYEPILDHKTRPTFDRIADLWEGSLQHLNQHPDFDTFDRLSFLTNFINPLYSALYDFQKTLNIEFKDEVDPTLPAHNYRSKNLFDDNFFNTAYYAKIATSDLNDATKIQLGRLLFFDPVLSKNLSLSCASCHQPAKAFTDGLPTSKGNKPDKFTLRNAPSLVNSVYSTRYFWDMREYDLERQIKHVIHDSLEFNIDFLDLVERLKESSEYQALFKQAYGKQDKYGISTWSISNALATYVNSLTSFNSEFDQYVKGKKTQLPKSVQQGFNLFMGKAACGTCHFAPVFNGTVPPYYQDSESEVLGVLTKFDTLNPVLDNDFGRVNNKLPNEEAEHFLRSFKTVTVRNATLTAPYMHNGAFQTLDEVMAFYNRGGGAGLGLDVPHQTLPESPLNLNDQEIKDIIAFIGSLTDIDQLTEVPDKLPIFEKKPSWNNRYKAAIYKE